MNTVPSTVVDLVDRLRRLPGIGPRSAERLAYHLLRAPKEDVQVLIGLITKLKEQVGFCSRCFNISESELCLICSDLNRRLDQIIVVEDVLDVMAIEKSGRFTGQYHVLGGVIDPLRGIGPEELRINELVKRVGDLEQFEIILATNPSTEGETTAIYLRKLLRDLHPDEKFKITRIARGLPVGADVEYADPVTLSRSLEGRTNF